MKINKLILLVLAIVAIPIIVNAQDTVKSSSSDFHIVKTGDTLYKICVQYDIPLEVVKASNTHLKSINSISVGDTIYLDPHASSALKSQLEKESITTSKAKYNIIQHIVGTGETLYKLSNIYKTHVETIIQNNPAIEESNIRVGDTLVIISSSIPQLSTATKTAAPIISNEEKIVVAKKSSNLSPQEIASHNSKHEEDLAKPTYFDMVQSGTNVVTAPSNTDKPTSTVKTNMINRSQVLPNHLKQIDYDKHSPITHKISTGQTLYQISKMYQQDLATLKEWNTMDLNDIAVGTDIIVGWFIPDQNKDVMAANLSTVQKKKHNQEYLIRANDKNRYKEIKEDGLGKALRGDITIKKSFYALHKSAPMFSILKVTNPVTYKSVFVKVIGKLPETDANKDLNIKLTDAAIKQLGLLDDKFKLNWVYHIPVD